jgi:hypothetical protein
MANRFIGGVLSSQQPSSGGFVSRASTGTYFNNTGTLVTAPINQPRLNYSFNGNPISTRYSLFSNSSGYLSTTSASAFAFNASNFTIEYWSWQSAVSDERRSIYSYNSNQQFLVGHSSNTVFFAAYNGSGTLIGQPTTGAGTLVAGQWNHIAVVRNGSTVTIYINGVSQASSSAFGATAIRTDQTNFYVGTDPVTAGRTFNGYLSNVRIVNGVAVYTGNFTVPSAPLTATQSSGTNISAITGTSTTLLTCQNSSFTDFSPSPLTITNNGGVASTFLPPGYPSDFSGTGWYNPTVLIEPPATNLIQYSTAYTNGFWTPYNIAGAVLTVTANTAIAPDGTQTASTITGSATSGFKVIGPGAVTSWISVNGAYTYSFFVKAGTASYVTTWAGGAAAPAGSDFAVYNLATGALTSSSMGINSSTSIINVGNGWWRVIWTSTYNSSNSSSPIIGLADPSVTTRAGATSSTGTLYIWGSQFEQGSTATSYIPTNGATVTRLQDNVGPLGSGIYTLTALENQTSIDDQATVQTYTSVGSTTWTCPADVTSVEILVVAGGGGGGISYTGNTYSSSGGGGAGGLIYNASHPVVPGTTYPITVGAGGAAATTQPSTGANGQNSIFGTLVAIGGGGGAGSTAPSGTFGTAGSGGSGGGGSGGSSPTFNGGPAIAGQGYPGGTTANNVWGGAGGGGAGGPGSGTGGIGQQPGYPGGPGLYFNISGTLTAYAGGGGGGGYSVGGVGGIGGGGAGGYAPAGGGSSSSATAGTANTGGGGGGGTYNTNSAAAGGSGIVIVKYKRTQARLTATSNTAVVTQKFSVSNTWTAPAGVTQVEILVVGGGGGGGYGRDVANTGSFGAGGGGAGGLVYNSALSITPGTSYTVTVGAGGAGSVGTTGAANQGSTGSNSTFSGSGITTITAYGGGGGGGVSNNGTYQSGLNGGSGGGAGAWNPATGNNGAGVAGQGNSGGLALTAGEAGGGGGGAGQPGQSAINAKAGDGGAGLPYSITGNLEYYAGGGAGSSDLSGTLVGRGGIGGGGGAGSGLVGGNYPGLNGAPNTGGGGGAAGGYNASPNYPGGNGGSGVVILRYRVPTIATFQDSGSWTCPAGVTSVQALIVGGGGSGSGSRGASNGSPGGGAGGVVYSSSIKVTPGVTYPVIVGQGGIGISGTDGYPGQNSSFAGIVAYGGGGGNGASSFDANRFSGGSGGGAGESYTNGQGVYGQGNAGGTNTAAGAGTNAGAGGGGAGGAGTSIALNVHVGGNGGPGLAFSISGTSTYYGGGGGGSCDASSSTYGTGGVGGGGNSTVGTYTTRAGTPNTGGGGGGAFSGVSADNIGGFGGSGIVIIRYYGG